MSQAAQNRPQEIGRVYLAEAYRFLDQLRESGETNMFGAAPYLQEMFRLEYRDAKKILMIWMEDFSK